MKILFFCLITLVRGSLGFSSSDVCPPPAPVVWFGDTFPKKSVSDAAGSQGKETPIVRQPPPQHQERVSPEATVRLFTVPKKSVVVEGDASGSDYEERKISEATNSLAEEPLEKEIPEAAYHSFAVPEDYEEPLEKEIPEADYHSFAVPEENKEPLEKEIPEADYHSFAVPEENKESLEKEIPEAAYHSFSVPEENKEPLKKEIPEATDRASNQSEARKFVEDFKREFLRKLAEMKTAGAFSLAVAQEVVKRTHERVAPRIAFVEDATDEIFHHIIHSIRRGLISIRRDFCPEVMQVYFNLCLATVILYVFLKILGGIIRGTNSSRRLDAIEKQLVSITHDAAHSSAGWLRVSSSIGHLREALEKQGEALSTTSTSAASTDVQILLQKVDELNLRMDNLPSQQQQQQHRHHPGGVCPVCGTDGEERYKKTVVAMNKNFETVIGGLEVLLKCMASTKSHSYSQLQGTILSLGEMEGCDATASRKSSHSRRFSKPTAEPMAEASVSASFSMPPPSSPPRYPQRPPSIPPSLPAAPAPAAAAAVHLPPPMFVPAPKVAVEKENVQEEETRGVARPFPLPPFSHPPPPPPQRPPHPPLPISTSVPPAFFPLLDGGDTAAPPSIPPSIPSVPPPPQPYAAGVEWC